MSPAEISKLEMSLLDDINYELRGILHCNSLDEWYKIVEATIGKEEVNKLKASLQALRHHGHSTDSLGGQRK